MVVEDAPAATEESGGPTWKLKPLCIASVSAQKVVVVFIEGVENKFPLPSNVPPEAESYHLISPVPEAERIAEPGVGMVSLTVRGAEGGLNTFTSTVYDCPIPHGVEYSTE